MNVYLNKIAGIDDAIVSMYMSSRHWSREFETLIYEICKNVLNPDGSMKEWSEEIDKDSWEFNCWLDNLLKWGWQHTTMLRFIDFSITVEGLHRAGQDDWDAHAARFNNRIIRNSTRTKTGFQYELSSYYRDKVIPTDMAAKELGIELPETMEHDGRHYVKTINGYILASEKDNPDVRRGLYMLSIPSDFIFKVNLTEWAHVYKMRNELGHAHPEVKQLCEKIADLLEGAHKQFNRDLFNKILN